MADEPISALTLFTSYSTADEVEILDVSDTTFASTGTNKRIQFSQLLNMAPFVASGASHIGGAVPDPGSTAGTTHFLREDATWAVPAGGGSPGGTSGQIQTNNGSGGFGALAVPLPVADGGTGLATLTAARRGTRRGDRGAGICDDRQHGISAD